MTFWAMFDLAHGIVSSTHFYCRVYKHNMVYQCGSNVLFFIDLEPDIFHPLLCEYEDVAMPFYFIGFLTMSLTFYYDHVHK